MASFTTSNVSTNTTVGRELSIASSFVKQYYTLLNKAPCFIHNFYSHDSTFIHGTIEMANDYYTEPVVGREKIKKKMDDLKLNDCRAKIKQIDCLATLAGGLVIQVIGELSNNGRPMRRFLQTFVLAPSPDETRQEGDSHHARPTDRRNVHSDENNSSSQNQKFFVLNSIFRYQDEGPENEFEDDVASINASVSVDGSNGGSDMSKVDSVGKQSVISAQPNGSVSDYSQNRRLKASENVRGGVDEVERLANDLEEGTKLKKSSNEPDFKRESSGQKVVSNGTGNLDKKNETSEKPTENGKTAPDHSQPANALSGPGIETTKQPSPAVVATRPPPSYEPKTWANMVRNNTQSSASVQLANVNKPAVAPAAASVAAAAAVTEQQQHQNVTQTSSVQAHPQQQQHHQQQNQHHHQQQQQHQQQHPQQQPQQQQSPQQQQQQQLQQQGSQNPRRRNMMRKPSNKSTGRSLKNRPPRPMTGNPGTTGGKPIA